MPSPIASLAKAGCLPLGKTHHEIWRHTVQYEATSGNRANTLHQNSLLLQFNSFDFSRYQTQNPALMVILPIGTGSHRKPTELIDIKAETDRSATWAAESCEPVSPSRAKHLLVGPCLKLESIRPMPWTPAKMCETCLKHWPNHAGCHWLKLENCLWNNRMSTLIALFRHSAWWNRKARDIAQVTKSRSFFLGKEARISRSYHYNILFQVAGFQTQRPVEDQVAVLQVKTSPGGDGFCL